MLDYGSTENNLWLLPYPTGRNQPEYFYTALSGECYRVEFRHNKVRHPVFTRAGGRLRSRAEMQRAEAVGDAVEIIYPITIETDGDSKPAFVAGRIFRVFP